MSPTAETPDLRAAQESAGRRLMAYLHLVPRQENERFHLAQEALRAVEGVGDESSALRLALDGLAERIGDLPVPVPDEARVLCPPPFRRTPMAPERMDHRSWLRTLFRLRGRAPETTGRRPRSSTLPREYMNQPWGRVARRRRRLLIGLVLGLTALAVTRMAEVLPHGGRTGLEIVLLVVFGMLFAWISVGSCTAAAGFLTLLARTDRFAPSAALERTETEDRKPRETVRTAVVFPVYNEDMPRVCAGLETVWYSLARTGREAGFDLFVLSDTQDPDGWPEEEAAVAGLAARLGPGVGLHYRRRRLNTKKKSGNVADFCRRFGNKYNYMVVMDADSVMTGETLVRMVRIMERKRHVGILQTIPAIFGRETFLARAQQFSSRLYGPLFAAGLHYWLLGDAQYWGHNAIIRVKPFVRHCALPRLSGRPPLGGDIISHDFVEAALMRRAGWSVWLAHDLKGSFEECPPTLLTELARDRRWCKGNLQHLRLFFSRGIFPAHRALFLNGVLAYGSALLWVLFLAVSTAEAVREAFSRPVYFSESPSLFPTWPVWEPWWAMSLLATTGVVLFLPKLLAWGLVALRGQGRDYGGLIRLAASILVEVVLSTLLAPIRMLFHSRFVFLTMLGVETPWTRQQREDRPTGLGEALRFHAVGSVAAGLWAAGLYLLNREFFLWVSPIFLPLILAVPVSMLTSRPELGLWLKRRGLLLTPEETDPPRELRELAVLAARNRARDDRDPPGPARSRGLTRVALVPEALALHLAGLRGPRSLRPDIRARRLALADKAAQQGPQALTRAERKQLLLNPDALMALHRAVWRLPEADLARAWGVRL